MARTGFRVPEAAAAILAAALALLSLAASPALAQGSLKDFLFGERADQTQRRPAAPPVARYVSETGEGFILDRSSGKPLLKFESSYEVWALQPEVGPRGDINYKNDLGQIILRATKLGGFTLFTRKRPSGSSAEVMGAAPALRLKPVSPLALYQLMRLSSARASKASGRVIAFEADATPASSPLIADASVIASEAIVRLSSTPKGRVQLEKIGKVVIVEGARPSVVLKNGVLLIVVTPDDGMAGRPSSDRIIHVAATR
ncbi:DUF4908 domain-containing protein [Caulobacter mirabilis]|uniref:DUF4908 domain-containing protein n=1 Tax=Caulobacter mirabilis TaxID=69666 RepID=A0A2D2AUP2_9CAUL|nr:DUF4908 domain-containing protein [Caulobacter mirabilis]ATQ41716.1 DUF4908 domain-containing protein [Caulobacter mirabilis]